MLEIESIISKTGNIIKPKRIFCFGDDDRGEERERRGRGEGQSAGECNKEGGPPVTSTRKHLCSPLEEVSLIMLWLNARSTINTEQLLQTNNKQQEKEEEEQQPNNP